MSEITLLLEKIYFSTAEQLALTATEYYQYIHEYINTHGLRGILQQITKEHFYIVTIILLSLNIMFSTKKIVTIPRTLQKRIVNKITQQNTTIQTAKLYIHIFTTTIAEYRKNVDYMLEHRSRNARGMLIIKTVGGKVPIHTEESLYTLLYCAIAFDEKTKPFEKEREKQLQVIKKALGSLPHLDKHSKSKYHSYMALAEFAKNQKSFTQETLNY